MIYAVKKIANQSRNVGAIYILPDSVTEDNFTGIFV